MTETPDHAVLEAVAGAYRHQDKVAHPADPLQAAGGGLKWYNLAAPATPVPPAIEALARRHLDARGVPPGPGFVILHRCGDSFYFLLVSTWRNNNELWETVCAKTGPDAPDFDLFPLPDAHRATFCVWELGIVWHEARAWKRFLRSPRAPGDLAAYLGDRFAGPV